jgi:hypothetical protein
MVRRFSQIKKNEWRALQIWQILIAAAHNRQTLTYGLLAKLLGYKGAGVFALQLGHIAHYCNLHGLPPLTSIVVNEETGLPGEGIPVHNALAQREAVYRYGWFDLALPTPAEFLQATAQAEREYEGLLPLRR